MPDNDRTKIPQPAAGGTGGAATAAGAASRPRRSWLLLALPLIVLFPCGVVAGYLWIHHDPAPTPEAPTPSPALQAAPRSEPPQEERIAIPADPAAALELGDRLIAEANFSAALTVYQELSRRKTVPAEDSLHYRVALACEGAGMWDQALDGYTGILSRSSDLVLRSAAQLGKARVQLRRSNPAEAKALLNALVLCSGQAPLRKHPMLADAHYLLALAMAHESLCLRKIGPFDEALASSRSTQWPIEHTLDWVSLEHDTSTGGREKQQSPVAVRRLGPEALDVLVSHTNPCAAVEETVTAALTAASLQARWSAAARQAVAGRTVALALEALALPDLLRGVLDPLGVCWRSDGRMIEFLHEGELDAESLLANRRGGARRALREAMVDYPGHALMPAAYLELGNDAAQGKNLREAGRWYARLVREFPHTPLIAEACYNLGLIQRQLGEGENSRAAFYQVVDRLPGNGLSGLAYLWIGRSHLEEGQAEKAISPLRRAVAASTGPSARAMAALFLGAAYLLNDNPLAANQVLVEQRRTLDSDRFRSTAALLDCLARFRAQQDRRKARREAGSLLDAILACHGETLLGTVGQLLLGQAYGDVGMPEQRVKVYEKLLSTSQGAAAEQAAYLFGDALLASDASAEARKVLTALAARSTGAWASRAQKRLAQLAFEEKRTPECLDWCRKVLSDSKQPNDAAVLKLMGKAYEQMGDVARAARCFAGMSPD